MGEVVRLKSSKDAPLPHPSSVELMEVPPEDKDQPHVFFDRVLTRWEIAAERACGAKWKHSRLIKSCNDSALRVAHGADLGRK